MKYRNWSIAIALALTIDAQAHAAKRDDTSANAGMCAVYLDHLNVEKKWSDKAWEKATDIGEARMVAQFWQHGMSMAEGTVQTSYLMEGKQACVAIGALPNVSNAK